MASLTDTQKHFYNENGCIIGLPPVFSAARVAELNGGYAELTKLLRTGESPKEIREWHESSRWLYDICSTPQILDYVESILGPDFFLWASNFFSKAPHTPETVGWHQDAFYWPLHPHNSVTVWIAFTDVDGENGAMKVIPATHKSGLLKHTRSTNTDSVLTLELERGTFREDAAVSLNLKAGEISLHDDAIVHGSPANHSERWRIGLSIRYSGTNVKCDLAINPYFKAYLMRGVDTYNHNPQGVIPAAQFGRLERDHKSIEEAGKEEWHGGY